MDDFIKVERINEVDVIRFYFNEITLEQRKTIKEKLQELLDKGEKKFIIDLSKVGFVSSLVLALIVFFAKEVKAIGGELKISGLTTEALSVFQITQLDTIFEVYDTEHDALESFKKFNN